MNICSNLVTKWHGIALVDCMYLSVGITDSLLSNLALLIESNKYTVEPLINGHSWDSFVHYKEVSVTGNV